MLNFLKLLFSKSPSATVGKLGFPAATYDEDGHYVNPEIAKLSETELMIPAEKARILNAKSIEEVKVRARKKMFQLIHGAIKQGKTQIRLETYQIKSPEVLTYLDSLGYTVRNVIPPNAGGRTSVPLGADFFDEDGEDSDGSAVPYNYYIISWNEGGEVLPEGPATGMAVVSAVNTVSGTVTMESL